MRDKEGPVARARRQRLEQGLPPQIEDPEVLAVVVALLAKKEQQR